VAKNFDIEWTKGLLFKLTILNFLSCLKETMSSYLHCRTFQTSFQSATSTRRVMRAGVNQDRLISPVLFSLYVNGIPTPSRHIELAQCTDDTAIVATARSPSLLVSYLETYLGRIEQWLRDWGSAINVSKITAVLFVKTARSIQNPEQSSFSENQYSGSKQHSILG
jgi:hypothetical protein